MCVCLQALNELLGALARDGDSKQAGSSSSSSDMSGAFLVPIKGTTSAELDWEAMPWMDTLWRELRSGNFYPMSPALRTAGVSSYKVPSVLSYIYAAEVSSNFRPWLAAHTDSSVPASMSVTGYGVSPSGSTVEGLDQGRPPKRHCADQAPAGHSLMFLALHRLNQAGGHIRHWSSWCWRWQLHQLRTQPTRGHVLLWTDTHRLHGIHGGSPGEHQPYLFAHWVEPVPVCW